MKTIEQIALEVANTSFVDRRNNIMPTSTFMGNDDELLTFTKRLIEAWLEQQSQEPVAWMGRDGEDFSYKESSYFTQPLFLAPQLVIPEGYVRLLREQGKQLEQERDASRDMLESTRLELELLREAMGVPVEPHQSLSDRMLEAVEELKEKLVSTEQRLQRRMEDIQEQAKRYVTLESNCQAIAAQNEALRSALEVIAGKRQCCDNTLSNLEMARYALNLPNLAAEVLKRRDAEIDLAADRLEVLEREHAEFFDRWHGERRMREKLVDDVERCYRMLLSEPNTKGALFKAENILREALADAKASTFVPVRLSDGLCNG